MHAADAFAMMGKLKRGSRDYLFCSFKTTIVVLIQEKFYFAASRLEAAK